MQSVTAPGGMAAVRAPVDRVVPLLAEHPDLALAAVNAPDQCVISGGRAALAAVVGELSRLGIGSKELPVSHAFHSPLMDEVTAEFRAALDGIAFGEPTVTLVSNLSGLAAGTDELRDPAYWARLIREPVDFLGGMRTVAARGAHAMLEIGPGRTLVGAGRQCVPAGDHLWSASEDPETALAELYVAGLPVDWAGVHDGRRKPLVDLPTYAFDRRRYWLPDSRKAAPAAGHHPLLGVEVSTPDQLTAGEREFAGPVSAERPAYLVDHQVTGQVVFPAAGFVELLLAALDAVHGDTGRPIRDLTIHEALFLSGDGCTLRTRLRPAAAGGGDQLEILSTVDGVERRHVTATAAPADDTGNGELARLDRTLRDAVAADGAEGRVEDLYADFDDAEMSYGPAFRLIRSFVRHGADISVAELTGPGGVRAEHLPPPVLDAALQSLATVIQPGLPVRFRAFRLFSSPRGAELRSVIRLVPAGPESDVDYLAEVLVLDGDRTVCVLTGLELRRVARTPGSRRRMFHEPRWVERPAPEPDGRSRHLVMVHSGPIQGAVPGARLSFADDLGELGGLLAERPTDVCWFWRPGGGTLREECERHHGELLELVRLLTEHGFGPGQRLWLVTRGAQQFPGEPAGDETRLTAATAWGFGAVLANEYPAYRVTMVDLPPGDQDLAAALAECLTGPDDEPQVAYRAGRRHIRRLEPADPDERPEADPPAVDDRHTYVITGGFGGLGLATARTLAGLGARHLALVGRRAPAAERLSALRAELGDDVTVHPFTADIAEPDDVAGLFGALSAAGPPVGGVVHAAGLLADKPVNAMTWPDLDEVFRAKVYGSLLLHQATAGLPEVRFFVGYASSSTVFGQAGQANYAAGNAFLDALAHWRAAQGLPGTSIDWGPWDEIGMAAGMSDRRRDSYTQQGMRFIQPRNGMRALATLLARPAPQVVVGECDWTTFAATRPLPSALYELLARPAERAASGVDLDELRALPADERAGRLAELVRGTIADVLHFDATDEITADASFPTLGLDSLAAVEVKNKLEAAVRTALPVSITFDYPTAEALASYLDSVLSPDGAEEDRAGHGELDDLDDADAELAALKEAG